MTDEKELDGLGEQSTSELIATLEQIAATPEFECFRCKHTVKVTPHDGEPDIVQCASCSARVAYGEKMPRIVVQPYEPDRRFVAITIEGEGTEQTSSQIYLDRRLAKLLGRALDSIT